jgi:hypothetical protein
MRCRARVLPQHCTRCNRKRPRDGRASGRIAYYSNAWKDYDGEVYELQDGTRVGLRVTSSSGGATIDIDTLEGVQWKIHIK